VYVTYEGETWGCLGKYIAFEKVKPAVRSFTRKQQRQVKLQQPLNQP
jgi:hypothetical protein